MSPSVKQYLTIDQQIELLRSRGMETDVDPARWLRAVNYYRLSGYWYIYRTFDSDGQGDLLRTGQFLPGTTFSAIADLYEFDRKLRSLVHDGLERVEVALRSQVSYVLGARDALAHENTEIFRDSFDHAAWLAKARSRVSRAAKHSGFISHHVERYDGVIPIWVLVEVLDFSDVSMLLDGMSAADQYAVAEGLGIRINLESLKPNQRRKALKNHPLARWLEQLTIVRNISAHHGRLWNRALVPAATNAMRTVPGLEALPSGQSEDVYGALTVIAKLLKTTSPGSTWVLRVVDLTSALARIPERSVRDMGFPHDWRTFSIWQG